MKTIAAAIVIVCMCSAAHADIYVYKCKFGGKASLLKLDDAKKTLQWLGKTYRISDQPQCPRLGWRAEKGNVAFNFCTATEGMAQFQFGSSQVQCDQQ
ncbi:hypothetical protein RHAL1_03732 [Beijerinckiaceae bacterium RH AL1]|nr:hypothetical protein [Beijerinckiaceae bacterium]VVB49242.1 hypothetical protein RHCH11_RHCH11_03662 [Beijerinckiaceae bacterium RH CH11]VVB49321.1 hypothetical protein RHAL8_03658 [Beijerinckiaceae bacterium RH AL8]VVC56800.1 hypothetical protein RHAL1_03732 [Beijerinckiaceae bacterium RH AL1]